MNNVEGGNLFKSIKRGTKKISRRVNRGAKKLDKDITKAVYKTGDKIKSAVNKKINLMSKVIFNNAGLAPYVQDFINKNGQNGIKSITLCRSQVPIAIRKLMIKMSKHAENKVLYHLYMIVTMDNGKKFMLEKNERINVMTSKFPKAVQKLNINESFENIKVKDLFDNTKKLLGTKKYFNYNASSSNCQHFLSAVVASNNLMNAERQAFIKQDTTDIFRDSGSLRKLSNFIVNEVASRANILMSGGTIKRSNPWLLFVKEFRSKNVNMNYKQVLVEASKAYKKQ